MLYRFCVTERTSVGNLRDAVLAVGLRQDAADQLQQGGLKSVQGPMFRSRVYACWKMSNLAHPKPIRDASFAVLATWVDQHAAWP